MATLTVTGNTAANNSSSSSDPQFFQGSNFNASSSSYEHEYEAVDGQSNNSKDESKNSSSYEYQYAASEKKSSHSLSFGSPQPSHSKSKDSSSHSKSKNSSSHSKIKSSSSHSKIKSSSSRSKIKSSSSHSKIKSSSSHSQGNDRGVSHGSSKASSATAIFGPDKSSASKVTFDSGEQVRFVEEDQATSDGSFEVEESKSKQKTVVMKMAAKNTPAATEDQRKKFHYGGGKYMGWELGEPLTYEEEQIQDYIRVHLPWLKYDARFSPFFNQYLREKRHYDPLKDHELDPFVPYYHWGTNRLMRKYKKGTAHEPVEEDMADSMERIEFANAILRSPQLMNLLTKLKNSKFSMEQLESMSTEEILQHYLQCETTYDRAMGYKMQKFPKTSALCDPYVEQTTEEKQEDDRQYDYRFEECKRGIPVQLDERWRSLQKLKEYHQERLDQADEDEYRRIKEEIEWMLTENGLNPYELKDVGDRADKLRKEIDRMNRLLANVGSHYPNFPRHEGPSTHLNQCPDCRKNGFKCEHAGWTLNRPVVKNIAKNNHDYGFVGKDMMAFGRYVDNKPGARRVKTPNRFNVMKAPIRDYDPEMKRYRTTVISQERPARSAYEHLRDNHPLFGEPPARDSVRDCIGLPLSDYSSELSDTSNVHHAEEDKHISESKESQAKSRTLTKTETSQYPTTYESPDRSDHRNSGHDNTRDRSYSRKDSDGSQSRQDSDRYRSHKDSNHHKSKQDDSRDRSRSYSNSNESPKSGANYYKTREQSRNYSDSAPRDSRQKSDHSPRDSRQKSDHSPRDSRQKSDRSPRDSRQKSDHSPRDSRQKSDHSPRDSRQKSDRSPRDSRQKSDYYTGDSRQKSDHSPRDSRQKSDYYTGDSRQKSDYYTGDSRQKSDYYTGDSRQKSDYYTGDSHQKSDHSPRDSRQKSDHSPRDSRQKSDHSPRDSRQRSDLTDHLMESSDSYQQQKTKLSTIQEKENHYSYTQSSSYSKTKS